MKKKIKMQELRGVSKEELIQKKNALKQELFKLNEERYTGRVNKPHMFLLVRKDIARIETLLHEKKEK